MDFILWLKEINKNDVKKVGGKGASLGELSNVVSVPDGFVVSTSAFDFFLEANNFKEVINAEMKAFSAKDDNTLKIDRTKIKEVSSTIIKLILSGNVPEKIENEAIACFDESAMEYVAVRSSASMEDGSSDSWAGELESYLNTDKKQLIKNIKKCWASLFSSRAISYSVEKQLLSGNYSVAVVVQKMVQSEVSGVVFTANPVNKDKRQTLIESCWGLGEFMVGGVVTPDNYLVDKKEEIISEVNVYPQGKMLIRKKNKNVTAKVPSNRIFQQKLSGRQIMELVEMSKKIETHFKKPQDIEWALINDKFFILQSRPITTIAK